MRGARVPLDSCVLETRLPVARRRMVPLAPADGRHFLPRPSQTFADTLVGYVGLDASLEPRPYPRSDALRQWALSLPWKGSGGSASAWTARSGRFSFDRHLSTGLSVAGHPTMSCQRQLGIRKRQHAPLHLAGSHRVQALTLRQVPSTPQPRVHGRVPCGTSQAPRARGAAERVEHAPPDRPGRQPGAQPCPGGRQSTHGRKPT